MKAVKVGVISAAIGLSALSAGAASLSPSDAASHIGETATVCGTVASTKFDGHVRSKPTFPDFGNARNDPRMISDLDIWRAATLLIGRYGARADLMLDRGDFEGQSVWMRIRRAIEALQAPPSGRLH